MGFGSEPMKQCFSGCLTAVGTRWQRLAAPWPESVPSIGFHQKPHNVLRGTALSATRLRVAHTRGRCPTKELQKMVRIRLAPYLLVVAAMLAGCGPSGSPI